MDKTWWLTYIQEVNEVFTGQRFTTTKLPETFNTTHLGKWFKSYSNSGTAAISLAEYCGAKRIIMLGYDCQKTDGKSHWHGSHPKNLLDAKYIDRWPKLFQNLKDGSKAQIINSSRVSALEMFPKIPLEEALDAVC